MRPSRLGGELTVDRVLQALAALGTPAVIVDDEPTHDDLLAVLGGLLASTEAALCSIGPEELAKVQAGYSCQITNADAVLQLLSARLGLLALQLAAHPATDSPVSGALRTAGAGAIAVNGLLGVHILTRPDATGTVADTATLRRLLRDVRSHLGNTKRGFDRLVETLRGRCIQPTDTSPSGTRTIHPGLTPAVPGEAATYRRDVAVRVFVKRVPGDVAREIRGSR